MNEETASLQEQLSHLQVSDGRSHVMVSPLPSFAKEELVTVKMEQRKCEALSHEVLCRGAKCRA